MEEARDGRDDMWQPDGKAVFRRFILAAEPIYMREPLAATLGAFERGTVLEYSYADAIRLAGHCCPTVTGAFIATREALRTLYAGQTAVRGEIAVTVYGAPEEGVFGVMSQVMSFITGAAPATGFRGLGPYFKRQGLLVFSDEKPDAQASCFRFTRIDNGDAVLVCFRPWMVPFDPQNAARMAELMQKVVPGTASDDESAEFADLWAEKVAGMVAGKDISSWLEVENAV